MTKYWVENLIQSNTLNSFMVLFSKNWTHKQIEPLTNQPLCMFDCNNNMDITELSTAHSSSSRHSRAEQDRQDNQAFIYMGFVTLFFICNLPRCVWAPLYVLEVTRGKTQTCSKEDLFSVINYQSKIGFSDKFADPNQCPSNQISLYWPHTLFVSLCSCHP